MDTQLLREPEVVQALNLSRSTFRRMLAAQLAPLPIRVGRRGVRWRPEDVTAFVRAQTPILPEKAQVK